MKHFFNFTYKYSILNFSLNSNWTKEDSPYECIWDKSYYGSTIVTDWYLICEKEYMTGLTQTIYMFGALTGFLSGYFSDKYGRKKICLLTVISMFLAILMSELLIKFNIFQFNISFFNTNVNANYFVYCISQYMIGLNSFACYVTSYVLLLEITTSTYSTIVSTFNSYMYVFGELLVLMLGYFVRDWHEINWCVGSYSIGIIVLIALFLPESPRVLVANKKYTEAYKVLEKIALINGKQEALMNEKSFVDYFTLNEKNKEQSEENLTNEGKTQEIHETVWQYLMNPIYNLIKTLLLMYVWISLAANYYAQSLGSILT